jgi:hypothetical protein
MTENSFIRLGAVTGIVASFDFAIFLSTPQNRFQVLGVMILF